MNGAGWNVMHLNCLKATVDVSVFEIFKLAGMLGILICLLRYLSGVGSC